MNKRASTAALGGKRLLDVIGAGVALFAVLPLLVVIALAIVVREGLPVLFAQERPGYKGRPFRLYKFRTMINETERDGRLLDDGERLTAIGRLLRRTSLDELPQLWNVLMGDMSLVGPRPLLMEYLDLYTADQRRRHDMRPGLTGLAQVNGRNDLDWDEKFSLDVQYVDHWSLALDIRILLCTVRQVLKGTGIARDASCTMPHFTGGHEGLVS